MPRGVAYNESPTTNTMSEAALNVAVRAATEAAHTIRRAGARMHQIRVEEKNPNDFVTEIDRQAESAIIENITQTFPEHNLLSEECGLIQGKQSEWLWIIDPLDGTSNFIHGLPHYSISIACLQHGRAQAGVIVDVTRNQHFTAIRGQGAYCDKKRIRASGRENIARCLVCTGIPTISRHQDVAEEYSACLLTVAKQCSGIRRSGSAALDLAWVAAGYLDGFFELKLQSWDIAAGALIVQEAGGIVSDFSGSEQFLLNGNVLCATPGCYRQLLPMVHKHLGHYDGEDNDRAGLRAFLQRTTQAQPETRDDTPPTDEHAMGDDKPPQAHARSASAGDPGLPPQTTTTGIKSKMMRNKTPSNARSRAPSRNKARGAHKTGGRNSYKTRERSGGRQQRKPGTSPPGRRGAHPKSTGNRTSKNRQRSGRRP